VGGNGNGRQREGARGGGGDRRGATNDAEMRERGEQRARYGKAEAGAHFIGPGRWWGGGEEAGGSGVLILIGFEGVKEEVGKGGAISVGEGRRRDGASVRLYVSRGGRQLVAHSAVTPATGGGNFAEQRREMIPSVGRLGPEWPR
jgi:hypothetical protein